MCLVSVSVSTKEVSLIVYIGLLCPVMPPFISSWIVRKVGRDVCDREGMAIRLLSLQRLYNMEVPRRGNPSLRRKQRRHQRSERVRNTPENPTKQNRGNGRQIILTKTLFIHTAREKARRHSSQTLCLRRRLLQLAEREHRQQRKRKKRNGIFHYHFLPRYHHQLGYPLHLYPEYASTARQNQL